MSGHGAPALAESLTASQHVLIPVVSPDMHADAAPLGRDLRAAHLAVLIGQQRDRARKGLTGAIELEGLILERQSRERMSVGAHL